MDLQSFIENYGYAAILVGTFLEGETILILAGPAAHLGYLNLPLVMLAAFLGSLSGDQLFFCLGGFLRNRRVFLWSGPGNFYRRLEKVRIHIAGHNSPGRHYNLGDAFFPAKKETFRLNPAMFNRVL